MHALLFYLFSSVTLLTASLSLITRHPVRSVILLICTFFNASVLLILIGAEYTAMVLIIVHAGAVAVLFLFTVMMLDIDLSALRYSLSKRRICLILLAMIIFAELAMLLYISMPPPTATNAMIAELSNTQALGMVLYTDHTIPFQLLGILLLTAIIGTITLTLHDSKSTKKRSLCKQGIPNEKGGVTLEHVKVGEGIKIL